MGEPLLGTDVLAALRDLDAGAQATEERLRVDCNRAADIHAMWADLRTAVERDWVCHALAALDTRRELLAELCDRNAEVAATVDEIRRACTARGDALMRRYPHMLEQAASGKIVMDERSRHPRYAFEQGFFTVQVDETPRAARISDYEGALARLPADPEAVVERLLRERSRVFDRSFHGTQVLKALRREYLAAVKQQRESDGASIPIRTISRRMSKRGGRTDEFLIDLSRLVTSGPLSVGGRELDLQHTREAANGMLLHGLEQRGYVGYVVFRKAG